MLFEIPVLCRIFSTTLLRYFNKNLLLLMPPKYVSALTGKITYDVDPIQNILYRYPVSNYKNHQNVHIDNDIS